MGAIDMNEYKSPYNFKNEDSIPIVILTIIILWAITPIILCWLFEDISKQGAFGDQFGAINALFSGMAFVGVIYAILLQKKELELQRKELRLTTEELAGQKAEFQEQNKTLKQQRFENTFFQMLSLHNTNIDALGDSRKTGSGIMTVSSRGYLKELHKELNNTLVRMPESDKNSIEKINILYDGFYSSRQSSLGHYLRFLYRIFKFVDESDVEDKKFYTNIVRAQLSNQELLILFYNCLNPRFENFKIYIEKYSIFDNLPISGLHSKQMTSFYHSKAYG